MFISKYGVARHIYIPIVKRGVIDFAVGADWTPAAGDVRISKDGGASASVTNLPTAITMSNTALWDFSLTATEMQAAQVVVTVADSATKAVEDQAFIIQTHGHASAMFQADLSDGVRLGLTALPNAAADAAGGLPISDAGGLDLDARIGVDVPAILVDTGTTLQAELDGIQADTEDIQTRLPAALVGGRIDATVDGTGMESTAIDAILDDTIGDGTLTMRQALRVLVAGMAGKLSGAATTTVTIRNTADSANVIVATVDADGNRSAVTVTP